jgi:hypothetical protein
VRLSAVETVDVAEVPTQGGAELQLVGAKADGDQRAFEGTEDGARLALGHWRDFGLGFLKQPFEEASGVVNTGLRIGVRCGQLEPLHDPADLVQRERVLLAVDYQADASGGRHGLGRGLEIYHEGAPQVSELLRGSLLASPVP